LSFRGAVGAALWIRPTSSQKVGLPGGARPAAAVVAHEDHEGLRPGCARDARDLGEEAARSSHVGVGVQLLPPGVARGEGQLKRAGGAAVGLPRARHHPLVVADQPPGEGPGAGEATRAVGDLTASGDVDPQVGERRQRRRGARRATRDASLRRAVEGQVDALEHDAVGVSQHADGSEASLLPRPSLLPAAGSQPGHRAPGRSIGARCGEGRPRPVNPAAHAPGHEGEAPALERDDEPGALQGQGPRELLELHHWVPAGARGDPAQVERRERVVEEPREALQGVPRDDPRREPARDRAQSQGHVARGPRPAVPGDLGDAPVLEQLAPGLNLALVRAQAQAGLGASGRGQRGQEQQSEKGARHGDLRLERALFEGSVGALGLLGEPELVA
jgi:hypothetical protein